MTHPKCPAYIRETYEGFLRKSAKRIVARHLIFHIEPPTLTFMDETSNRLKSEHRLHKMKTIYYCVVDDSTFMGKMYWALDNYQTIKYNNLPPEETQVRLAKELIDSTVLNYIGHIIEENGDDVFVALLVDNGLSVVGPLWRSDISAESFCRSLVVNSCYIVNN